MDLQELSLRPRILSKSPAWCINALLLPNSRWWYKTKFAAVPTSVLSLCCLVCCAGQTARGGWGKFLWCYIRWPVDFDSSKRSEIFRVSSRSFCRKPAGLDGQTADYCLDSRHTERSGYPQNKSDQTFRWVLAGGHFYYRQTITVDRLGLCRQLWLFWSQCKASLDIDWMGYRLLYQLIIFQKYI